MLKIHTFPQDESKSNLYSVEINSKPVLCEFARVSAMPFNMPWPGHQRDLNQTEESAFISFEGDEFVKIKVTAAEVKTATIRPLAKNVKPVINEKSWL